MKKIPAKYSGIVFTFYATMLMAFIMSAVLVALNTGIGSGWVHAHPACLCAGLAGGLCQPAADSPAGAEAGGVEHRGLKWQS